MNTRERQTKLYVYDTEADARANTSGTEYTQGMVDGSQRYEHTFFTAFPGFGETNAAMYECEISGTTDLTDKWIRVKYVYYATDSATSTTDKWVFLGKVDSCKYDRQQATRHLIAFDKMYELRSVDVSAWWITYWATQTGNVTAKNVVIAMCAAFGVAQSVGSVRNDFQVVKAAQDGRNLGGCAFTDILRYVGEITGMIWMFNSSGELVNYNVTTETAVNINDNFDTSQSEIEDADLTTYGTLTVYDGADVIYTSGSTAPVWTFSDNVLLYGRTTANLVPLLNTTKGYLSFISGLRPATIYLIVTEEAFFNDGRILVSYTDGSQTRTSYVSGIELSGSQLINTVLNCTGEMATGTQYSGAISKAANDIQDLALEMTFKVNSDGVIQAVNLQAEQSTVRILAQALNINGVVSANDNFKINSDGSFETIAGKIAGWIIEQTRLYKTRGDVTVELYAGDSTHSPRVRVYGAGKYVEMGNGAFTSTENYNGSTNVAEGTVVVNGRELTLTRSDWEEHATWSDWVQTFLSSLKDSKLTLKHLVWNDETTQYDEIETYVDYNGIHAANEVYAKGRNLLSEFKPFTAFFATLIPNNSNLNTTAFLNPGRYYIGSSNNAATLTNCPTQSAFYMDVDYPISALDRPASTYAYIHRTITTYNGAVYFQFVTGGATANVYTYGSWVQLRTTTDGGNVIKQINTNDNNNYQILLSEVTGTTAQTETSRVRKNAGFYYNAVNGALYIVRQKSATATNSSSLLLGNSIADGTAYSTHGVLWIYGKGDKWARFEDTNNALTANRIYTLPNKDGELAILSPDTFNVGNRVIEVTGADVARSIRIGTKAGGYVYLTYFANGNHGVYSSGYESDIADSSTFTSSNKWIIRRNSAGNVFIDEWASIGAAGKPVYFSSSGRPVAVSTSNTTATRNTTNTTSSVTSCVIDTRCGIAVSRTLQFTLSTTGATNGKTLFTGLPKPKNTVRFVMLCPQMNKSMQCIIDTDGNLKNDSTEAIASYAYYGNVSYVTE